MPHPVILYTPNIEATADMTGLCRRLADAMLQMRDEANQSIFPTGGTRVLAYPAAHHAVADGRGDYGFVYLHLRIAAGRSQAALQRTGDALLFTARSHLAPLFERMALGLTVQIDESAGQVYDGKHSTLHPLFNKG